jgi:hypothetical protein
MPESDLRDRDQWQPVPLLGSGAPSRTAVRSRCGGWQISRQQSPAPAGQRAEYYHLWRRDPGTGALTWVHTYHDAAAARERAAAEASR